MGGGGDADIVSDRISKKRPGNKAEGLNRLIKITVGYIRLAPRADIGG